MAKKKKSRKDDFLAGHGMTPAQQHGAVMRAAADSLSNLEGEYESIGTYQSPSSQRLQRILWESRMRREMRDQ